MRPQEHQEHNRTDENNFTSIYTEEKLQNIKQ